MESITKKRGTLRGRVTTLTNECAEYLKREESQALSENMNNFQNILENIASYMGKLANLETELVGVNKEIFECLAKDEKVTDDEVNACMDYAEKIINSVARLKCRKEFIERMISERMDDKVKSEKTDEKKSAVKLSKISDGNANENSEVRKQNDNSAENEDVNNAKDNAEECESETNESENEFKQIKKKKSKKGQAGFVQLKKIELSKFSGDYKQWLPFWEQFRELVHENDHLNDAEKFYYLKSVLEGKAAETIEGFTPSATFYNAAISLLLEEYGNSERLIDKHMNNLMSLPHVSSRYDLIGLRRLYNAVNTNSRALKALGVVFNTYAVMLKAHLMKCLPQDLRIDYHRYVDSSDKIELDLKDDDAMSSVSMQSEVSHASDMQGPIRMLMRFIKREIEALEQSGVKEVVKENKSDSSGSSRTKPIRTAASLISQETKNKYCIFCQSNQHFTDRCEDKGKTINERRDMLRKSGRCFKCTRKGHMTVNCTNSNITCALCKKNHATSMCNNVEMESKVETKKETPKDENKSEQPKAEAANLCSASECTSQIFLQTFCARAGTQNGIELIVRGVLDGGSQRSYIIQEAVDKLQLPVYDEIKLENYSFGSKEKASPQKYKRVKIQLKSLFDSNVVEILAVVVPAICVDVLPVPSKEISNDLKLELADTKRFGEPLPGISILIGAQYFWSVFLEKKQINSKLTAIKTKFGWTIEGEAGECYDFSAVGLFTAQFDNFNETDEENDEITRFWNLESLGISENENKNDTFERDLNRYVRKENNRFIACLLWKFPPNNLDSYRSGAYRRFQLLTKKLMRKPEDFFKYDKGMREMFELGFAERVPESELKSISPAYYLPHHPVIREDRETTKLRIVFDASARAVEQRSLNDCLDAGPNMLPDVLQILLNFRIGKIAIMADIEKAFLQILLDKNDRNVHRFFWYSEPITTLDKLPAECEYQMTRVTFGIKCSPCLLALVLRTQIESADINEDMKTLFKKSFYMDDFVLSVDSTEEAIRIYNVIYPLMNEISMRLRKWHTNDYEIRELLKIDSNEKNFTTVLGINWNYVTDEIYVNLDRVKDFMKTITDNITKRQLLQLIARFFDPIGILSPFVVKLKIIFQEAWRLKLEWDSELPDELKKKWKTCIEEFKLIKDIFMPRWLYFSKSCDHIQLHIFADASPAAYGVVAYIRINNSEIVKTSFLCAKNRLAPLKHSKDELTLPKLELTAALLAARLKDYLTRNLRIQFDDIYLWTDSQITLKWITGDNNKWKSYVSNRVNEIQRLTDLKTWRHCPGIMNPADYVTRCKFGKMLSSDTFWLEGPDWLKNSEENWPKFEADERVDCSISLAMTVESESVPTRYPSIMNVERFSSWMRLLRVTAYLVRFVNRFADQYKRKLLPKRNLRNRINENKIQKSNEQFNLTKEEIFKAKIYWIKATQEEVYARELKTLRAKKPVPSDSVILSLRPILDEENILRSDTRLKSVNEFSPCPIILPKKAHITKLILKNAHEKLMHAGVTTVLCKVREEFWIPQCRQLLKTIIKSCEVCRKLFAKAASQPFAPLPRSRLIATKPFQTTGIDFAGPLYVKSMNSEEKTTRKVYLMIFTCAVVRAVHLEMVEAMSVESCLLGIRRFIARRGVPHEILSDNAKTFKRASKDMKLIGEVITNEHFQNKIANLMISWKFIVERAPWWGGFWERLIKNVKNLLKLTIGKLILNGEELNTLLIEAEAIVNSRPLTYISDDPFDLNPLTPAHFIQASSLNGPFLPNLNKICPPGSGDDLRNIWKARCHHSNQFWQRWKQEYIQLLRSLHHTRGGPEKTLKLGEVVLVHDPGQPRTFWKLAKIIDTYPNRTDGRIRSCKIKYANGVITRRPINLLFPLEIVADSPSAGPEDVEN